MGMISSNSPRAAEQANGNYGMTTFAPFDDVAAGKILYAVWIALIEGHSRLSLHCESEPSLLSKALMITPCISRHIIPLAGCWSMKTCGINLHFSNTIALSPPPKSQSKPQTNLIS
ncbi:unnamed protein product [Cyclocybe aegerita]|uniref:Uncharacterized protein n=1 Tax=Cyclocybe aegerita TaxID=1973307 RepID=A0A8S0WCF2_CYCAE|nr:unnamed protein product [Cyclocybe aegerita]